MTTLLAGEQVPYSAMFIAGEDRAELPCALQAGRHSGLALLNSPELTPPRRAMLRALWRFRARAPLFAVALVVCWLGSLAALVIAAQTERGVPAAIVPLVATGPIFAAGLVLVAFSTMLTWNRTCYETMVLNIVAGSGTATSYSEQVRQCAVQVHHVARTLSRRDATTITPVAWEMVLAVAPGNPGPVAFTEATDAWQRCAHQFSTMLATHLVVPDGATRLLDELWPDELTDDSEDDLIASTRVVFPHLDAATLRRYVELYSLGRPQRYRVSTTTS